MVVASGGYLLSLSTPDPLPPAEIKSRNAQVPAAAEAPDRPRLHAVQSPRADLSMRHVFSADSVFNASVRGEPIDPTSDMLVRVLDGEVAREQESGVGPWINTGQYSVPVYSVPARQTLVRIGLDKPQAAYFTELRQAFSRVPLPGDARPAAGTDAHLVVYQPATDRLWEFWGLRRGAGGWHARWGGAIGGVSKSPGFYGGRHRDWGASASSISIAGGLITPDELRRGRIAHALAIAVPNVRARQRSWPAQRTDGRLDSPEAIPEGARFRLDPGLDLDSLHLPRVTRMLAEAAQNYGIIVRDQSPNVAFYAQDVSVAGQDRYPKLLRTKDFGQVLSDFPWNRLQLLQLRLSAAP
jgi:hypothetical protein